MPELTGVPKDLVSQRAMQESIDRAELASKQAKQVAEERACSRSLHQYFASAVVADVCALLQAGNHLAAVELLRTLQSSQAQEVSCLTRLADEILRLHQASASKREDERLELDFLREGPTEHVRSTCATHDGLVAVVLLLERDLAAQLPSVSLDSEPLRSSTVLPRSLASSWQERRFQHVVIAQTPSLLALVILSVSASVLGRSQ